MFLTAPKKTPSLRHYTDEELLRLLRFSDNHEVAELVKRFELLIGMNNFNNIKRRGGKINREGAIPVLWEWPAVIAATVAISLTIMDAILP